MMFGAILHAKWEIGNERTAIIGYWAEDNTQYLIIVPYQIRDQLLTMQNWLSEKYQTYLKCKEQIKTIENFFE